MSKTKIVLGGGAGYIGSALAPVLVELGYEVTVIDLLWFGNHLPKEVTVIKKDLFECTAEDLKGQDIFIFLAGLSNDPMAEFSPAKNFVFNAALPAYLAFEAKKAGIKRYIYASSCSVYGYTVDELYDEESPATCAYPYGISKLQGERGVMQLQDDSFSVIGLRQGTVSGYSPRLRLDLIVNAMFTSAMTKGEITVNNPAIWRPLLDIRDAVSAYVRSIQADNSVSGIFNVSSGNYTVGQVADVVKLELEKLTDKKLSIDVKNIQDFRNYKVTVDKAQTYLGFQPQYTVNDTVTHMFENLSKIKNFDKESYYNIRVFKKIMS